ncbi:hypothetical protein Tco_0097502 [Tanacetum coccineum]
MSVRRLPPGKRYGQSEENDIQTLEDMVCVACVIDFAVGNCGCGLAAGRFSYNYSYHVAFQGGTILKHFTGRKWTDRPYVGSRSWGLQLTGTRFIRDDQRKIIQIKNWLLTARRRQKSYADVRRKPMEFNVGDRVMLKVSPWKGVIRFVTGKSFRGIHNTFHVSNLKKCLADENLVIPLEEIQLDDKLHFIEEPMEIMDREVKQLKQSRIPIVKVRWNSRRGPEFTWEREDFFMKKYLHLFPSKKRGRGDNRAPGRRSLKEGRM